MGKIEMKTHNFYEEEKKSISSCKKRKKKKGKRKNIGKLQIRVNTKRQVKNIR